MSETRRPSSEFKAGTRENAGSKRSIEVAPDLVKIAGVKIERNPEAGPRVPPVERFATFSEDEFSLNLLQIIAKSAALDQPLLLEGEAASGKSYTIEYLAHLCNKEVYRMSLNGQTDTTDLIGKWVPRTETVRKKIESIIKNPELCQNAKAKKLIEAKTQAGGFTREELETVASLEGIEVPEGEWMWQDGDIPKQMKDGAWSVLDEVNTCEPQILVRLNALLEKGGQLVLSEDGSKVVSRHKDFRLFATVNPPGGRYKGRIPLSAEWISRWNYQNVGELPKAIRALRLMAADGVPVPEIKAEKINAVQNEEIPTENTLADFYGVDWVRDLYTKYAEFAEQIRNMLNKGELAKDQTQVFDFDQRDDWRFREYIRKFHEPGRMKKTIQEAVVYCFANKCKSITDRKKVLDQMGLLNVTEPRSKLNEETEIIEDQEAIKKLEAIKKELAGMGLPEDHKGLLLGKETKPDIPAAMESLRLFIDHLKAKFSARAIEFDIAPPVLEMPNIPEAFTPEHQEAMAEIFGEKNLEPLVLPAADQLTEEYLKMMYPEEQSEKDTDRGLVSVRGSWWKDAADTTVVGSAKANWGEVYVRSMKSEASRLGGALLLTESISKPKYKSGSQQYGTKEGVDADKDSLLPFIHEVFGAEASRFNLTWDQITNELLPKVKSKIEGIFESKGLPKIDFDVIITPALANNIQTTLNHPENSQTDTYEWTSTPLLKQDGTDSGNRLVVGYSENGGAGSVDNTHRGHRRYHYGFRLSVVLKK